MSGDLRLVIFDCDGTLLDSQRIIHAAMNHAYETAGLTAPTRSETLRVVGLSLVEAIKNISPDFDRATCEQLAEGYKASFNHLRLDPLMTEPMFEGADHILNSLNDHTHTIMGIATGKSRRGVDRFIAREELHGFFDTIQTADDAPSKPHPMMIHQALGETGVDAENAVMIGDTTYDMEMAVNAGVRAIGVSWGYHTSQELERSGASVVINHFSELDGAL